MALHGSKQLFFGCTRSKIKSGIKSIEGKVIMVGSAWWARAAVGGFAIKTVAPAPNSFIDAPSAKLRTVLGILKTTQCTHTFAGASGSSTIRANVLVPAGSSDHCKDGETFAPSHVYCDGIDPL